VAFLDETGSIAVDRFFGVGCLKLREPSRLLRGLQKLRDRHHWYTELHWVETTRAVLPLYQEVIDLVASADSSFSCFVADRSRADPVARFGSPWRAYEKLAAQLLLGSIPPQELVNVVADNYSTPDHVVFEQDVRADVNRRLGGLVITSVCRMDSKAADPLQVVDLLTAAVAFEFRQAAGLAGHHSPKAVLAEYLRSRYGVRSFLRGHRSPSRLPGQLNVKLYTHGRVANGAGSRRTPAAAPGAGV
jgi:hypothetical protein